jgi:hypothetical protein
MLLPLMQPVPLTGVPDELIPLLIGAAGPGRKPIAVLMLPLRRLTGFG